jgi:hypothetical protein
MRNPRQIVCTCDIVVPLQREILRLGDDTGYKSAQFSLLRPISMKEKSPHRITHLVLWVEVLPKSKPVKTYRKIHIKILTICYNKKLVLSNKNIHKL